jgi:hypothetical protein
VLLHDDEVARQPAQEHIVGGVAAVEADHQRTLAPLREPDEPLSTFVVGVEWLVDIDVPTGVKESFHQRQMRGGCRVDERRPNAGFEERVDVAVPVRNPVGVPDPVELGPITGEEMQFHIGPGGEDGKVGLLGDVAKADHANTQRRCRYAVPSGFWHPFLAPDRGPATRPPTTCRGQGR